MTGNDIRRAYDRLRPDEDARERMLRAIREEAARGAETPHRKRRTFRGTLILAAALVLVLGTAAYATGLFGLRSAVLYHQAGGTDEPYGDTDVLSLQGLANSPEGMANARWQNFCSGYDPDGAILSAIGNGGTGLEPRYDAYPCYTREMADELDAIAEEYGLALLTPPTLYGGGDPLPARIPCRKAARTMGMYLTAATPMTAAALWRRAPLRSLTGAGPIPSAIS